MRSFRCITSKDVLFFVLALVLGLETPGPEKGVVLRLLGTGLAAVPISVELLLCLVWKNPGGVK